MVNCILGGYTYPYNPVTNKNPPVRAISVTDTLGGRTYTDWGTSRSRQEIMQTWPTLDADVFNSLKAFVNVGPTSYTHDDGTTYTVIAADIDYAGTVPGGVAYLNVTFKLYVLD